MNIIQKPSPNYNNTLYSKVGVMIHKTLGTNSLGWLRNPKSYASAHLLFARDGTVYQLVQYTKRAWSAGRMTPDKFTERAKKIAKKTIFGSYVKPGEYLIQCEFECLSNEKFTQAQYNSATEVFKSFPFEVNKDNLVTHKDFTWDKPLLEKQRTEILKRLHSETPEAPQQLILDNWQQLRIKVERGKIILTKKI